MLVLSRRYNETIVLTTGAGEIIAIRVCKIEHGNCRLGIDAPPTVAIRRDDAKVTHHEIQVPPSA